MPLPQIIFNKDSPAEIRGQALSQLEKWLDSKDISAVKTQVVRAVMHYAKKKLMEQSSFDVADLTHFTACHAIFNQRGLPDLLFLQQVIQQLSVIGDETSELKKAVLPMVLNYKRSLLLPLVRQMEKACFGLSVAVLFMRDINGLLLRLINFFTSALTAEAKVERLLNDRYGQPAGLAKVIEADDYFDEGIQAIDRLLNQERKRTLGFFNQLLQTKEQITRFDPLIDLKPETNKRK